MTDQSTIIAHTDGACRGNPGPGGWGAVLRKGTKVKELYGGVKHTTNQRMELQAAIEVLKALKKPDRVITIYSDSKYVVDGISKWITDWKKNGWRNSQRKPVANQGQWEELDALNAQHRVRWEWVKGHSGNLGNEAADALAKKGIPI